MEKWKLAAGVAALGVMVAAAAGAGTNLTAPSTGSVTAPNGATVTGGDWSVTKAGICAGTTSGGAGLYFQNQGAGAPVWAHNCP